MTNIEYLAEKWGMSVERVREILGDANELAYWSEINLQQLHDDYLDLDASESAVEKCNIRRNTVNSLLTYVTYPGQSEAVRVGLGTTVWLYSPNWEYARSVSLTWEDDFPQQNCTPDEFVRMCPLKPGGRLEREAKKRGLL